MTNFIKVIIALAALSFSVTAQAQHPGHGHKGPRGPKSEAHKALRAEIHQYLQDNALPVMTEARNAFDEQLSRAEKAELAKVRQEMETLRAQGKQLHEQRKNQEGKPSEEQREAHQELRKQHRALMERVHDIADAHEAELESTLESLREDAHSWKEGLHSILETHKPELDSMRAQHRDRAQRGHRNHRGHGPHGQRGPHELRKLLRPVGFLLWEPGDWPADLEPSTPTLAVFPNPTQSSLTLSLEQVVNQEVRVEVLSHSGKAPLISQTLSSASLPYRLDLSQLEKGVYILRLIDGEKVFTEKVFVE